MISALVDKVSEVVLGKEKEIQLALACIFAKGHLLIEDIPGIGKTTLAKSLAKILGLDFKRIQCTSDMLPGDILGVSIFDQKSAQFHFHKGPVFTQILLADEINRTTPKTQSALLEAMEELQVTIEGKTIALEAPFFVIATQNPLEQSGTYRLPESQLDRFLIRINLGYPNRAAEKSILRSGHEHHGSNNKIASEIQAMLNPEKIIEIQKQIENVYVSDTLLDYIQNILDFSRVTPHFYIGLSPRAGKALLSAAKSWAFCCNRGNVIPEDVQEVLTYVTSHRLHSRETRQEFSKDSLTRIFSEVPLGK